MSTKTAGILNKVEQDRRRGDHQKALKRLEDGIKKLPGEILLYREAIDIAMEAGESLRSGELFKSAQRKAPHAYEELWNFGKEKVEAYNDPVLCKSMLIIAIKGRDLEGAAELLEALKDHTLDDLLKRVRNKKQSLDVVGGQMFKSELVVNTLAEALLCVRSKRYQDGARSFVQVLDDKPVEHQVLTPYLTILQKRHPKRGGISYALGCSCLASEKWEEGISRILHGVSLAPANADDAIERIEALRDKEGVPAAKVELALAKLKILQGDEKAAVEMLRELLGKSEGMAREILALLETHIDGDDALPALDYLYIETAMIANNSTHALRHIKRIHKDRRRRSELLSWLDEQSQDRLIATEILACYGEMLLEQEMYERSVEVFRELLSKQPHQAVSIREMLSGHRKNTSITEFYDEIAGDEADEAPTDDGFSIEHFGGRDFSLNGRSEDSDQPSDEAAAETFEETDTPEKADDFERFDPEPNMFERERSMHLEAAFEAEPFSEDNGASIDQEVRDEELTGYLDVFDNIHEPEDTDAVADLDVFDDAECAAEEPSETMDAEETREKPLFDDVPMATGEPILLGISDIPPDDEDTDTEAMAGEKADFESRFAAFESGGLDNNDILELVEDAARSARMLAMKTLLEFKPENPAQEMKRKYYLAEYYLHEDQPLSALMMLRTVNISGLSKEERKAFLLRYAHCYQQLNRFDDAQSTYLRIMDEYPEFSAAEHMAKACYQRYLQSSTSRGPVLEKVSSLGTHDNEEEEL